MKSELSTIPSASLPGGLIHFASSGAQWFPHRSCLEPVASREHGPEAGQRGHLWAKRGKR